MQLLSLHGNQISNISALAGLNNLRHLELNSNQISDLQPLVDNPGLDAGDNVYVRNNPLGYVAINTDIPILQSRGVGVYFDNRIPTSLTKISGDGQTGEPGSTLSDPFVVKVDDQNSDPYEGVPVTFTVTAGGGSLSNGTATTDTNGLAETTLTLGPSPGTNTVEVTAPDIATPVTFNATTTITSLSADANGPYTGNEGSPITFTGDASGGTEPYTYFWDFDNDEEYDDGTGETAEWTFTDDGTFQIGLKVTDDLGSESTDTASVTVSNVDPTVDAGTDQTVNEGEIVSFNGSFTDPGSDDTHTIDWDFGDGDTASGILLLPMSMLSLVSTQ